MEEAEIILIEDNPSDAELALRALKMNAPRTEILWLKDGEEALNYFFSKVHKKHLRPKLILLDLKLPKIDGFEVLRQLKESPRTKMIPIVMLTSSGEEKDILACYSKGVNSYIVKPLEYDSYMHAVGTAGMYWLHLNQSPE